MSTSNTLTNYIAYHHPDLGQDLIGHYNLENQTVQPLCFISGTPISNLYQVIEAGETNITSAADKPIPISEVKILAPLVGRDVLCVGKNYAEHAKEFNSSGFDSSDKVDQPSHPVIFTKRFTSIIAHGEQIYPHPEFTKTADFEGEIGVIIGKPCHRVSEEDAMQYVWGFTIVNDMTARERQRDHKQFYIGKSPDTFCPMGPIAVPAAHLDPILQIQTRVNRELRQNATTEDLIFSIPFLIKTMSEGQTLMPGDILATGTPAGVGIGHTPPIYLSPGDEISISVNGLGTLTNSISSTSTPNPIPQKVQAMSCIPSLQPKRNANSNLRTINNKPIHYSRHTLSSTDSPILFVHGLGGTREVFTPLIQSMDLDKSHDIHLFDLEGHGLSPTSPLSKLSIESFAQDVHGILDCASLKESKNLTIVGHDLGCLIAAYYASQHPDSVAKLLLVNPPPLPAPEHRRQQLTSLAYTARRSGMPSVHELSSSNVSRISNPLAKALISQSLLNQDSEGYAKACTALAEAPEFDWSKINAQTLVVTGSEDSIAHPDACKKIVIESLGGNAGLEIVPGVGEWSLLEDVEGVKGAIGGFFEV